VGFAVGIFENGSSAYVASRMSSGGNRAEALNNAVARCRRWAISQTAQGAYDRCEEGGYDCNAPIGTCL
jgi:hypothetical protein